MADRRSLEDDKAGLTTAMSMDVSPPLVATASSSSSDASTSSHLILEGGELHLRGMTVRLQQLLMLLVALARH